jgi:hypothetical protein
MTAGPVRALSASCWIFWLWSYFLDIGSFAGLFKIIVRSRKLPSPQHEQEKDEETRDHKLDEAQDLKERAEVANCGVWSHEGSLTVLLFPHYFIEKLFSVGALFGSPRGD